MQVGDLVEFLSFGRTLTGVVIKTGQPNHAGVLFSVVWSSADRKFMYLYEDDIYYNSRTLPRIISRCSHAK